MNSSAQAMARKSVTAAVRPSVVHWLATANSSRVTRFSGLEHATMSNRSTRRNMRTAWNLSVTMDAGRPATEV